MSYRVEFTSEATAGFEALTSTIQERILRKIRTNNEFRLSVGQSVADSCERPKADIAASE